MKKLLSLLMALLLTVALSVPAMAEDNTIEIEATLLSIMDMTADEWYASDEARVLLATCTLMDVVLTENETAQTIAADAVLADGVYIGRDADSGLLAIHFWGGQYCLIVVYIPASGIISAAIEDAGRQVTSSMITSVMDDMVEKGSLDNYYQVSSDDILSTYQAILDILNDE